MGPAAAAAQKPPSFMVIYLTVFLDFFANGVVLPVLQNHARGLGARGFDVGLVFTAYSTLQIPGSFFFGALSDVIGRRPIILISLFMSTVTLLLTAWAPDLDSLIRARALAGFFSETSVCQAYIADKTTREQRPAALGHMGAFIGLGFMVGPATGALLSYFGGFDLCANFTSVVTALNLIYAWAKLDESLGYETGEKEPKVKNSIGSYLSTVLRPMLALVLIGQFAITVAFMGWDTTFALWAKDRLGYTQRHTGWAFAWLALGFFIASWKTRSFAEHPMNSSRGGLVGCGMMAGGLLGHRLINSTLPLLLPLFGIGFGYALSEIVFQTLVSVHSPKELQGSVLGTLEATKALARAVAPVSTGYLFDIAPEGDLDYAYTYLAILPAAALVITEVAYAVMPAGQVLRISKQAGEDLGLTLKPPSLKVRGVVAGGPMAKVGGDGYVGLMITKVNGQYVASAEEVLSMSKAAARVDLTFAVASTAGRRGVDSSKDE
eukprot:TRINITY_DN10021_c0_g1_i1.p1 TRINITY_DN10021_c0_g1~~TRINITY_DN10021_c0_g1_i1.p1  ORF type:complete len:492 (+),score=169.45 TRINITY_DN10021_c0_g1_i1:104-1579(+)